MSKNYGKLFEYKFIVKGASRWKITVNMTKPCKKGKGCYEDICGKKYTFDDDSDEEISSEDNSTTKAPFDDNERTFTLKNPNITPDMEDVLYHLALENKHHHLAETFGDVKFVCCGGTPHRMEKFAYFILKEMGGKMAPGIKFHDFSIHSHRYALYKVGPVLSVSHGMGQPSISILMHELIKLMYHARVKDPVFFRLGTGGGLGVEPGTVVITTEPLNGMLEPIHMNPILGKRVNRPAVLNRTLAEELISLSEPSDDFKIVAGKTISTDDFYEGQGRLDGAFCEYTEVEKFAFLKMAHNKGVTNIEMESLAMASITHHVGIKCGIICVTLLDRLKGDQINQSKKTLEEWQDRPMVIAARYITKHFKGKLQITLETQTEVKEATENQSETKSTTCASCAKLQKLKLPSLDTDKNNNSDSSDATSGKRITSVDTNSTSSSTTTSSPCYKQYGSFSESSVIVSNLDRSR